MTWLLASQCHQQPQTDCKNWCFCHNGFDMKLAKFVHIFLIIKSFTCSFINVFSPLSICWHLTQFLPCWPVEMINNNKLQSSANWGPLELVTLMCLQRWSPKIKFDEICHTSEVICWSVFTLVCMLSAVIAPLCYHTQPYVTMNSWAWLQIFAGPVAIQQSHGTSRTTCRRKTVQVCSWKASLDVKGWGIAIWKRWTCDTSSP